MKRRGKKWYSLLRTINKAPPMKLTNVWRPNSYVGVGVIPAHDSHRATCEFSQSVCLSRYFLFFFFLGWHLFIFCQSIFLSGFQSWCENHLKYSLRPHLERPLGGGYDCSSGNYFLVEGLSKYFQLVGTKSVVLKRAQKASWGLK